MWKAAGGATEGTRREGRCSVWGAWAPHTTHSCDRTCSSHSCDPAVPLSSQCGPTRQKRWDWPPAQPPDCPRGEGSAGGSFRRGDGGPVPGPCSHRHPRLCQGDEAPPPGAQSPGGLPRTSALPEDTNPATTVMAWPASPFAGSSHELFSHLEKQTEEASP